MTPHYDPEVAKIEAILRPVEYAIYAAGQLIDLLAPAALRFLGSGAYAVVYQHPTRKNVAIKVGYTTADGWLAYAGAALAIQAPHTLRIESVRIYDSTYIAVMERLKHTGPRGKGSRSSAVLSKKYPAWYSALLSITELGVRPYDLHSNNIMFRLECNTPVIVDPDVEEYRGPPLTVASGMLFRGRYLRAENSRRSAVDKGMEDALQRPLRSPATRYRAAIKKTNALRNNALHECLA